MNNKMCKQISPTNITHTSALSKLSKYFPLIVLSVCGFTFNTSEFIPIGLLSDIAHDFFNFRASGVTVNFSAHCKVKNHFLEFYQAQ